MLGGISNKFNYSFTFTTRVDSQRMLKALLDLVVSTRNKDIRRWKVEFSSVVLTREFKPQSCKQFSNGYVCKVLFDVTPVIKSKNLDIYDINIVYPEINNEINLLHIGLFTATKEDKAETKYVYINEPLVLEPGGELKLKLPISFNKAYAKMTLAIPHSSAQLVLFVENSNKRIILSGYRGGIEYSGELGALNELRIVHEGKGSYIPREIIISSLFIYESTMPVPRLSMHADYLGEGKAKVIVQNEGDMPAENVIIVNIAAGNIIDRKVIRLINVGESKAVIVNIDTRYSNLIRAIWRFKGETYFAEQKIKV